MIAMIDDILPKISKNVYEVLTPTGKIRGFMTFLELRRAILPQHFLKSMALETNEGDVFMRLRRVTDGANYEIFEKDICLVFSMEDWGKDFACIDILDKSLPLHADIKKHFADPSRVRSELHSGSCRVTFVSFSKNKTRSVTSDVLYHENGTVEEVTADMLAELRCIGSTNQLDVINYDIPTVKGECGSLVFRGDKIVGMHAHGNGRMGQAVLVDLQVLMTTYDQAPEPAGLPDMKFSEFEVDSKGWSIHQGINIEACNGAVVTPMLPATSTFTKNDFTRWNPSGPIKPTVFPVDCSIENYSAARAKYGPKEQNIDSELLDKAVEFYGDFLLSIPNHEKLTRVLTLREAIKGIPGIVDPMDHQTSPALS